MICQIKTKAVSYSASVMFHSILILLFLFINLSFNIPQRNMLNYHLEFQVVSVHQERRDSLDKVLEKAKPEEKDITKDKNLEVKEVELPKAKNTDVSILNLRKRIRK